MMHRLAVLTTILALSLTSAPLFAAGAARGARVAQDQTGTVKATAKSPQGEALPNYMVRVRNLANGNLVGSTTTNAAGEATFAGLPPGSYAIEVVNAAGEIVGTSAAITVAAGATVNVTVTASAAAARGAAGGAAAAGGVGATAGRVSTAVIVTTVAVAAGVLGIVIARNTGTASPSR